MDFFRIKERSEKNGTLEIYPDFRVGRTTDLMVRGKSFYAIWDEKAGLWSTDEYDVQRLVDGELSRYAEEVRSRFQGAVSVKYLSEFGSGAWRQFKNYVNLLADNSHQLDTRIIFANTVVNKTDYVSRRLPYNMGAGDISAYDEIASVLYDSSNRDKYEWIIGSVIAGASRHIQKFGVFYGPAGAGKSTILNLIQDLFSGYYVSFEADALTSGTNAFSMEAFKSNPLLAIQHDGDLSNIKDNSRLNSIVSHEIMVMNEKYKAQYDMRLQSFLLMGTNKPVRITDAKSGIVRRLIDIQPSGEKIPVNRYHELVNQLQFELGAIAQHCLDKFRSMGQDYYSDYLPIEMMLQTDHFYNFVEYYYDTFRDLEGITQTHAYQLYQQYCTDYGIQYTLNGFKFRDELKNYFKGFHDTITIDGEVVRSYYTKFDESKFFSVAQTAPVEASLALDLQVSLLDEMLANQPAQYANQEETPRRRWAEVTTTLKDLNTQDIHYVKPPLNHIVIDFDLKGPDGEKDAVLNLTEASKWPPTYAEYSKGGGGIHLHYIYEGDPTELSRVYSDGIEIKVFVGDSSLRRRLTRCNDIPVATINSGLPLREKKMLTGETIKSEKGLRDLIVRNLNKEIHPATTPSIHFIHKILEEAYESGMKYDVSDLHARILVFANNSSHQSLACIKLVQDMKFQSEDLPSETMAPGTEELPVFFDVEVFQNLLLICYKVAGPDQQIVRMINPSPTEVERLAQRKLIGFNCRRYDNHILYARIMGYDNMQLYKLSKKIIDKVPNVMFGAAYGLSYVDIYDYCSEKMSLKMWQIKLGLNHRELPVDWDAPIPEERWEEVADYCDNDVITTEQLHNHRIQDFNARLILAEISGLPVNSSTNTHSAQIIFRGDQKQNKNKPELVYTDLATGTRTDGTQDIAKFPGYEFDFGESVYRDEDPSEGGYVYAEPGMYSNCAVLDVASMHPTSIVEMNLFGKYTENLRALMVARLALKRRDYDTAAMVFNGALKPYLGTDEEADALSYALKIVINSVYGLTAAKYDNPFRDTRNKDNIVAKRGALFMIDLKNYVQDLGYTVVHIKTDSIKIAEADEKIIELVMEFGEQYGYEFEHEATYERFCLVNDAVYIAWVKQAKKPAHWEAVGAQFQHPYVFKTLFSHEKIEYKDVCETKSVQTALYLDFTQESDEPMAMTEKTDSDLVYIGRAGSFVPVTDRGGELLRENSTAVKEKQGRFSYATGAKGHRWQDAAVLENMIDHSKVDQNVIIDWSYFNNLANKAVENISQYGDFEWFVYGDK